jgi:hypothetical protein
MRPYVKFDCDERNGGGRNDIKNLMVNHYNTLLNIKPTINTL